MKGSILFNPINTVQARNVDVIMENIPEYARKCVYNPNFTWFGDKRGLKNDRDMFFTKGRFPLVPREALDGVEAVVLFNAQPRVPVLSLVEAATIRLIPVIAIEEVHQMLMEQGRVDNYFLPVDHLFVASAYEKERFVKLGHPAKSVEDTGYVINADRPEMPSQEKRTGIMSELGLDPASRTILLSLAFLAPDGETREIRRNMIKLAADNIPQGYQLLIKPHPAESSDNYKRFIHDLAPKAVIADARAPIDKLLGVTDILINRGNSQVVIDALEYGIPVIVIPQGIKTFFENNIDRLIVSNGTELRRAIDLAEKEGMGIFKDIRERYLSLSRKDGLSRTVSRIKDIIRNRDISEVKARLMDIALFWSFAGFALRATRVVEHIIAKEDVDENVLALYKIVRLKPTPADIQVLRRYYSGTYKEWVVQSLFVRSLYSSGKNITDEWAAWLKDFPPVTNRLSFINDALMLNQLYILSGMRENSKRLMSTLTGQYGFMKEVALAGELASRNKKETHTYVFKGRMRFLFKKFASDLLLMKGTVLEKGS